MSCGRTTKSRTHTATISAPIVRGDYAFGAFDYGDDGGCLVKLAKTDRSVKAKDMWCNRVNELQNHHCRVNPVGDLVNMGHVTGAIRAFQCE